MSTQQVTVTGASDDLIELDGSIREEFTHTGDDPALLAFSDGTLLEVEYDKDGIWRVKRLAAGTSTFAIEPGLVERDTFDVAKLTGEGLRWCVKAERGEYNPAWAKK